MAPALREARGVREAKQEGVTVSSHQNTGAIFDAVNRHKNLVLSSPLVLAVVLMVWYALGGSDVRKVLDFFAPRHLF